ncbi:unnamed protein product [Brachionus calyciflorus]|uniref:Uncharacterized protein n=1 Tax=Brachionus calyciflorus TaxID=104777 RepID=A0A813U726_9BILA|nr:unnamed protein product [Brachionus calyciflorus]
MKFFIFTLLLTDFVKCIDYRSSPELLSLINNNLLKQKKSIDDANHSLNRSDYRTNFIKLVENFLLIHLKKLAQNERIENLKNSNSTLNEPEKLAMIKNPDDMKSYIKTTKDHLITIIIVLSILSSGLFIILLISCFVNLRQRSRLNFLSDNDFFTYYNSKSIPPLISSTSSFSLQPKKMETPKQETKINNFHSDIDSGISLSKSNSIKRISSISSKDNAQLNKEHFNFINGNLIKNKQRSKRIKKYLKNRQDSFSFDLKLTNQDSDDEDDIVLEHNLDDDNYELPKISLNFDAYKHHDDDIEDNSDGIKSGFSFSKKDNSIKLDIIELESSSYVRDRYYQILREQVFPYLQKSTVGFSNINQSNNDVLY